MKPEYMQLVSTYPHRAFTSRGISEETMRFFDVRAAVSEVDGELQEYWYPYKTEEGELTGYKCRVLPKDFASKGVTGKIKNLFGQHLTQGNRFLIIVEGEHDALAAREIMVKLKGKSYNVVSLPNGANEEGTLCNTTRAQLEWLGSFEKIAICLDQDAPGKATAHALADYLCSSTDVRITELPLKDTALMYEAGKLDEWMSAINQSRKYQSDQIVTGSDVTLKDLMTPLVTGRMYTFLPKTCAMVHGFRTRELTAIIGPPNAGKSSLMRQMMFEDLKYSDEPVGGFYLEETRTKTFQSVLAMNSGISLNVFRDNPKLADKQLLIEAEETLLPRLHLYEHRQKVLSDDLLERKIEYLVKAVGCRRIYIDHLSFIISGREGNDERRQIDNLLTRLARSVEDWDYALYIVSHIKRKFAEKQRKVDSYPYWNTVSLDDGRGSGAIEQLAHRMIGLENQILDPEEFGRGQLRTKVLRDREWGKIGIGDLLHMNSHGKLVPAEPVHY
jgi:KaiC/GvpD/RAD55 family RecA-like ATPase